MKSAHHLIHSHDRPLCFFSFFYCEQIVMTQYSQKCTHSSFFKTLQPTIQHYSLSSGQFKHLQRVPENRDMHPPGSRFALWWNVWTQEGSRASDWRFHMYTCLFLRYTLMTPNWDFVRHYCSMLKLRNWTSFWKIKKVENKER